MFERNKHCSTKTIIFSNYPQSVNRIRLNSSSMYISGSVKSASQLYKYYNGDLPWNAMLDWLSEDKQLHNLVLRAYR